MRLTYKSPFGDYGCAVDFRDDFAEKCAFRNKLGVFEDTYEWHPVEAGLPKEEGTYYVTVHDSIGAMDDTVLQDEFHDGKFNLESVDYKVVAWMSILIPEPYKEEE